MFVVNGQINAARASFEDIAKRLEAGIGAIAMRQPGFRGYYVIQTGERAGNGVLLFATAEDWAAAQDEVVAWYQANIAPLCEGEALATAGEVVASVEPATPGMANAASGVEARPH